MQNLPCTACDIISFKSRRHLPCAEERDLSNHTRMSMMQSNRFEKNEWFQKLSTPHPPTEGIFPWIPPPLPLSSFIHLLNFWAFEKPPPPRNFQSLLQGSMDISLNYTMQKKTWPKNNCNENLTPLPNCYLPNLKILKVLHLTLKIKWGKKNERRGKEREWNLVQRGGGSITFKPPNYVMYLEILPPAHSPTS